MSNVIHGHVKRYFNLPWDWIAGGFVRDAPPSAHKLFVFLYGYAHHHTATALQFANDELNAQLGLDLKSIRAAREWLSASNLIACRKCQPGVYEYALLIPGTSVPIPPPPKRRGKRLYDATLKVTKSRRQHASGTPENRGVNSRIISVENNGKTTNSSAANSSKTAYLRGLSCPDCGGPTRPTQTVLASAARPTHRCSSTRKTLAFKGERFHYYKGVVPSFSGSSSLFCIRN
jgi:hypothetical protein